MKRVLSLLLTGIMLASCIAFPVFAEEAWQCAICGKLNQYNFCTSCGTPKPEKKTCLGCGYTMEASAKFCMECGLALGQTLATSTPIPTATPTPVPVSDFTSDDGVDQQKKSFYQQGERYEAAGDYEQARLYFMQACGYKDALKRAYDIGYEKLNMGRLDGGLWFSIGVMADGEVKLTGRSRNFYEKIDTTGFENLKAISGGVYHIMGLRHDGTVIANGHNVGIRENMLNVSSWRNIVAIVGGVANSAAIDANGKAYVCGSNRYGECNVSEWTDIVDIGCGEGFTVGLRADGTVVAIGENSYGQCNVSQWRDIIDISVGYQHVLGLRKDGTVVAAGNNGDRQCNVNSWRSIKSISAASYHSVGLRSDGTVIAVGNYEFGQLKVSDWKNVVLIHADGYHTLGVLNTGKLVHIGRGDYGQRSVDKWKLW